MFPNGSAPRGFRRYLPTFLGVLTSYRVTGVHVAQTSEGGPGPPRQTLGQALGGASDGPLGASLARETAGKGGPGSNRPCYSDG
jgi:hypothetical protein